MLTQRRKGAKEIKKMYITCGNCGEKSPFEMWLERPTGEQLPDDHYRCPKCGVEIRRIQGTPKTIDSGFGCDQAMIVPGDITIEQITSRCVCPDDEWDPVPEHNICIACGKPRLLV